MGSFKSAIENCYALWGDCVFKRFSGGIWRDQFLGGIYDAQMISVDLLNDRQIKILKTQKNKIKKSTEKLFSGDHFDEYVRLSTNTPKRIKYRVEKIFKMLLGLI